MAATPDFTQPGWTKDLEDRWLRANHQLTFGMPEDWGYANAQREMRDVMATVKAGAMAVTAGLSGPTDAERKKAAEGGYPAEYRGGA